MRWVILCGLLLSGQLLWAQIDEVTVSRAVQEFENILNLAQRGQATERKVQRYLSSPDIYLPNDLGRFPRSHDLLLDDYLNALDRDTTTSPIDITLWGKQFTILDRALGDQVRVIAYAIKLHTTQAPSPQKRRDTLLLAYQLSNWGNELLLHGVYRYRDGDQDQVPDLLDRCPFTRPGASTNPRGCTDQDRDGCFPDLPRDDPRFDPHDDDRCIPRRADCDADGDGVLDDLDRCPLTRPGAQVDSQGCTDDDGDGYHPDVATNHRRYDRLDNRPCVPDNSSDTCDLDKDGIINKYDRCPQVKGSRTDGCPPTSASVPTRRPQKIGVKITQRNYFELIGAWNYGAGLKTGGDEELVFSIGNGLTTLARYHIYLDDKKTRTLDFGLGYQYRTQPYANQGDDSEFRSSNCYTNFNITRAYLDVQSVQIQARYGLHLWFLRTAIGIFYNHNLSVKRRGELSYQEICSGVVSHSFYDNNYRYNFVEVFPTDPAGRTSFEHSYGILADAGFVLGRVPLGVFVQFQTNNLFNSRYQMPDSPAIEVLEFYPYKSIGLQLNSIGIYVGYTW